MPSTGNTFVQTGENNNGIGATGWTTPENVVSDNASDATCNAAASSQYLVGRNCGFNIPTTSTVRGVTVTIEASEHAGGTESLNAQLQNDAGALVGSSKANTISGTGKSVYTYGTSSDVWGATLTPAIINDADFGVRLWFTTAHDVRIDYVQIAVQYTNNYTLALDAGSFTLTGATVTLVYARKITCTATSYAFTGASASIIAQRKLSLDNTSYAFTGADVTLRKGYNMVSDNASFAFTGESTTLKADRKLTASATSYSLTGQNAGLIIQRYLSLSPGSYSFSGQNVGLRTDRILQLSNTSYSWSGQSASVLVGRKLGLSNGAYVWTGQDVTLDYTPTDNAELIADPTSYLFDGGSVEFNRTRRQGKTIKKLLYRGTFESKYLD